MEFTCKGEYNNKTMAVMAKVLRKTVRKKKSRRSHIFGWGIAVAGLLLCFYQVSQDGGLGIQTVITGAAVFVIMFTLLMEDRINGYAARKRLLPGTERGKTVFSDDGFSTVTEIGRSQWKYDKIQVIAESGSYIVFVFSSSHGQIYDKECMEGGTIEQFRQFLETKTGKQIQEVL